MKRASISLPVPVSPWISTVASVRATWRARESSDSMRGLSVRISRRCHASADCPCSVSKRMRLTSANVNGFVKT